MDGGKAFNWPKQSLDDFGGINPNAQIGDNNLADNINVGDNPANAGQDEDVDQFFDDGGETFLPADHVCNPQVFYFFSPWWHVSKTLWLSNLLTSMSASICSFVRRKRKSERCARHVKRQVYSSMVFNTSWRRCRPPSNELMTITILCSAIAFKLNANMRSFRDNTKERKKKQMSSLSVCLRHKRSSINLTERWNKSRSTTRLWRVRSLSHAEPLTALKKTLVILKKWRKSKITW